MTSKSKGFLHSLRSVGMTVAFIIATPSAREVSLFHFHEFYIGEAADVPVDADLTTDLDGLDGLAETSIEEHLDGPDAVPGVDFG